MGSSKYLGGRLNAQTIFRTASVAVIGASTNPSKLGYAVLKNLVDGGYSESGSGFPDQSWSR
jgi:acyl-CoA synthetase (NDP forming)